MFSARMKLLSTFLLWLLAVSLAGAQETRYVTDSLKLESRSGPAVGNRIVRMLESGTPVRVLERRDGWSRIATAQGEAWILSRFLMDSPSARSQLDEALASQERAVADAAAAREELGRASAGATALEEERDALTLRLDNLARELAELKRTAASAVSIQEENRQLTLSSGQMQADLTAVREELVVLRRRQEKEWFLAGAGVLIGGMVLGLIIPKIRWKRRKGWSEL